MLDGTKDTLARGPPTTWVLRVLASGCVNTDHR